MFKDPVNTEDEFAVVKMDPAEVVVLDSSGTMFVADSKNNRVQVTVFNRTVKEVHALWYLIINMDNSIVFPR